MRARHGITSIDVVIAGVMVATLLAMAILGMRHYSQPAGRRAVCLRNLQSIAQAEMGFVQARTSVSPLRRQQSVQLSSGTHEVYTGWVHELLPYMDCINVYEQLQATIRAGEDPNTLNYEIRLLACPSDSSANSSDLGRLSYAVNAGRPNVYVGGLTDVPANGVFHDQITHIGNVEFTPQKFDLSDIGDGTSHTILVAETLDADVWQRLAGLNWDVPTARRQEFLGGIVWQSLPVVGRVPADRTSMPQFDYATAVRTPLISHPAAGGGPPRGGAVWTYAHPSSKHPGVFVVAMCDGSTVTVSAKVDYGIYCLLMSSNGRKVNDPGSSGNPPVPTWQSTQLIGEDSY